MTPCVHGLERYTHTHTAPDRGAANQFLIQTVESEACADRQMLPPRNILQNIRLLMCAGSHWCLSASPQRHVTETTETNAPRIGAIHLHCGTSTDQDRSKYWASLYAISLSMASFATFSASTEAVGSHCQKESGGHR